MSYYERNLPHWHPAAKDIFLTWRLYGSLPPSVARKFASTALPESGKQFRIIDQELDRAGSGPLWLRDARVAEAVIAAIKHGQTDLRLFDLHAFVVMANHVHLLITPSVDVSRITKGIKGASSRKANKILGRIGMRFWHEESFDHWIRNAAQRERVHAYIENNPVAAGLVKAAPEWPWSSATVRSLK
jgi:REP-associated tyrosine transposase